MKTVSIHDAKTNLSKYIAAAKKGQKVYIGAFGKDADVMLVRVPAPKTKSRIGFAKGKLVAQPDAFSRATDEAIAKLMLESDDLSD